ncbi:hypothetical protein [Arhodomonas sp. SL1]|uniref:hypothetical protein n=1 Tax=Arhodomonas sp. SL1 TaxID=3425691 RepID=UPI003F885724
MSAVMTVERLSAEHRRFRDGGGVSANNRAAGFVPAFLDRATGRIHRSCLADGRPAPCHCLDGLPADLVTARDDKGRVQAVRAGVIAGFLRDGRFYTREQAANAVTED